MHPIHSRGAEGVSMGSLRVSKFQARARASSGGYSHDLSARPYSEGWAGSWVLNRILQCLKIKRVDAFPQQPSAEPCRLEFVNKSNRQLGGRAVPLDWYPRMALQT